MTGLHSLITWENCAVVLAIGYLLLAMRENILCWYCALASSTIFAFLFWDVRLLMDSALNVYYMAMAVYGWQQWNYGGDDSGGVVIHELGLDKNAILIAGILLLSLLSGWLLARYTSAAWPYVDSFTTWASIVTTVLVVWKVLENWLYWLLIDTVSILIYIDKGLHTTALLFVIYVIIAVFGYLNWRRILLESTADAATT